MAKQLTVVDAAEVKERTLTGMIMDGWANLLTGLGMKNRDKRMAAITEWCPMVREDQESLFAGDELARKIVELVPDEALQKGYTITGISKEAMPILAARLRQLRFDEIIKEAAFNDRIHGGAGIFKVMEDGSMDLPLVKGKKLLALNIMNRWELTVQSTDIEDNITSPRFGEPQMYRLNVNEGSKSYTEPVHWTRIVRLPGSFLPRQLRKMNQYWGDSELNRLQNAIRNYSTSHDAVAAMLQDFSIPVLKMQGLGAMIAANGDSKVMKRLEIINMAKGVARMVILDADKESFEHTTRTVTGVKELVEKVEGRLVTSTNIPHTKLFGNSPSGMGGTGSHEETNWYDFLESWQTNYIKPPMLEVVRLVIDTEFPSEKSEMVDIEFHTLERLDEDEESDRRFKQAQTDEIYINTGVADPTEIASSRFGGDEYSSETTLEMEMRKVTAPDAAAETPTPGKVPKPPTEKKVPLPDPNKKPPAKNEG